MQALVEHCFDDDPSISDVSERMKEENVRYPDVTMQEPYETIGSKQRLYSAKVWIGIYE